MSEVEERGRADKKEHLKVNRSLWTGGKPTKIHKNPQTQRLPTNINGTVTLEQMAAYQAMYRIEEITSLLKNDHLEPPKYLVRSQSPPPKYDAAGRRINTKEQLYRKKLEVERYRLVEIAWRMIPFYTAPEGYVKPTTFEEKYYIPVDQYPEINFVGLLLGPRGNTLKRLQLESKCKIAIRGRGSVKEGKSAGDLPDGAMNMEDPLHCLIIADSEDKVYKGVKCCQGVVIKAVTSPEGQNDLKRNQLRDLAELNGTLREDNTPCSICGLQGHKKYDCPERETFAQRIICHRCGQAGHTTRDCQTSMPHSTGTIESKPTNRYQNNTNQSWGVRQPPHASPASRYQNNNQQSRHSNSPSYNQSTNSRYSGSFGNNVTTTTNGRYQSRYQRGTSTQQSVQSFSNSLYGESHENTPSYNASSSKNTRNNMYYSDDHSTRTSTSTSPAIISYESPSAPPGLPSTTEVSGANANILPPGLLQGENVNVSLPPGLAETTNTTTSLPPGLSTSNTNSEDKNGSLPPGLFSNDTSDGPSLPPGLAGPPGL